MFWSDISPLCFLAEPRWRDSTVTCRCVAGTASWYTVEFWSLCYLSDCVIRNAQVWFDNAVCCQMLHCTVKKVDYQSKDHHLICLPPRLQRPVQTGIITAPNNSLNTHMYNVLILEINIFAHKYIFECLHTFLQLPVYDACTEWIAQSQDAMFSLLHHDIKLKHSRCFLA